VFLEEQVMETIFARLAGFKAGVIGNHEKMVVWLVSTIG
jgi:hypothetical protein